MGEHLQCGNPNGWRELECKDLVYQKNEEELHHHLCGLHTDEVVVQVCRQSLTRHDQGVRVTHIPKGPYFELESLIKMLGSGGEMGLSSTVARGNCPGLCC